MRNTSAPEFRGSHAVFARTSRRIACRAVCCAALLAVLTLPVRALGELGPSPETSLPPFDLATIDDRRIELSSVRADAVLVHFFATWCEPCRDELASLARLLAARRNIEVLVISVAEPPSRVKRFAVAEGVNLPILLDGDRKVSKAWGVAVRKRARHCSAAGK